MMEGQLAETWAINNRINLYMLEAIAPEALNGVSTSKGRNVGEQFAHMHNVRLMWLESAAKDLLDGLSKIEKENALDKELLRRSLEESGKAIETLINRSEAAGGKIKGFKPHVTAFLGYLCAHEGYHRGEIGIILHQSGHKLDQKTAYGLWEWGVR
ncbi:MAG: DinB family protein [Anaerolineae bacterium]|nr:DinB family protein [Anaerolineae bacterium]